MTFNDLLRVFWQRKLLIVVVGVFGRVIWKILGVINDVWSMI